jgi:hypothetical protein
MFTIKKTLSPNIEILLIFLNLLTNYFKLINTNISINNHITITII